MSRVRKIDGVFGPVGGLVESLWATIDSNRKRAAGDDNARHALRGRRVQQTVGAPDVDLAHLLEQLGPAADAHLERQVNDRIDIGTCGAQRL